MIIIVSQNKFDYSTDQVIDWIIYAKKNCKRINGIDFFQDQIGKIISDEVEALKPFKYDDIVWFRRWLSPEANNQIIDENLTRAEVTIEKFHRDETYALSEYFIQGLNKFKLFSQVSINEINKMTVLSYANSLGLETPRSAIVNSRSQINALGLGDKIITKPISNGFSLMIGGIDYVAYTAVIDLDTLRGNFLPSLVQEYIPKLFEIRAFFLDGEFYSMAIFSQQSTQTKIDFRIYNRIKPNRLIPYILNEEVCNKLRAIANKMNLNACSFDLVMGVNSVLYFLEVNPNGQFGMVSIPCNYNLEQKIANSLIEKSNEKPRKTSDQTMS